MVEITETRHGVGKVYRMQFLINFDKACFIVLYKCPTIAQNVFKPPNKKLFMCKITVIWVYKFENVKLFWHLEFAVENFFS